MKGQAFIRAFASIKGAGTITEAEGEAATAALGNLALSQSAENMRDSLDKLAESLKRGIKTLRMKAGLQEDDDDFDI